MKQSVHLLAKWIHGSAEIWRRWLGEVAQSSFSNQWFSNFSLQWMLSNLMDSWVTWCSYQVFWATLLPFMNWVCSLECNPHHTCHTLQGKISDGRQAAFQLHLLLLLFLRTVDSLVRNPKTQFENHWGKPQVFMRGWNLFPPPPK